MITHRELRKAVPGNMFSAMNNEQLVDAYKKTSRAKSILKRELKDRGIALSDA